MNLKMKLSKNDYKKLLELVDKTDLSKTLQKKTFKTYSDIVYIDLDEFLYSKVAGIVKKSVNNEKSMLFQKFSRDPMAYGF
jgi:hypothetical protein